MKRIEQGDTASEKCTKGPREPGNSGLLKQFTEQGDPEPLPVPYTPPGLSLEIMPRTEDKAAQQEKDYPPVVC